MKKYEPYRPLKLVNNNVLRKKHPPYKPLIKVDEGKNFTGIKSFVYKVENYTQTPKINILQKKIIPKAFGKKTIHPFWTIRKRDNNYNWIAKKIYDYWCALKKYVKTWLK